MGIYDRDYYRREQPGFSLRAPRTMVGILILINVAIYVLGEMLMSAAGRRQFHAPAFSPLAEFLAAHPESLTHPWLWWQLLTYGFAHASDPQHILFNMLALWFLGRDVEATYGSKEFLWLYLAMIVVGGAVWAAIAKMQAVPGELVGASGAVAGVVVLYALNFPRRMLLLFFVIPVPAWLVGVLVVGYDMLGATGHGASNVAYTVHLAGAATAFLYHWSGWRFSRLGSFSFGRMRWGARPWLRIHRPPDDRSEQEQGTAELSTQVDQILEKIHREGEASLTRKERRVLESASREYQRRRPPDPK